MDSYNQVKDDLFNRIAAGTGNVTGIYFKIVDILGNIGAIIAVLIIIADVSYYYSEGSVN